METDLRTECSLSKKWAQSPYVEGISPTFSEKGTQTLRTRSLKMVCLLVWVNIGNYWTSIKNACLRYTEEGPMVYSRYA